MAVDISKTEYLKRYLENDEKKAKRKKKHKQNNPLVPRVKIVDKDIDLKSIKFGEKEVDDDDEAPVIADIIDERPEEVKIKEIYESSRWKKLDSIAGESNCNTDDDPIESRLHQTQLKARDILKHGKKEFSSAYKKRRHDSDDDNSPLRVHNQKVQVKNRHDSDSDASISPNPAIPAQSNKRHDSDNDNNSLTKPSSDNEKHVKHVKKSYHKNHSRKDKSEQNMLDKSRKYDSDSDLSPERLRCRRSPSLQNSHKPRKVTRNSDSDLSPERKSSRKSLSVKNSKAQKLETNSDSDLSPPRETGSFKEYGGSSMKGDKRPVKTLSGLKAGLQNAATLREETHELKLREKKQINELDSELSGKNADTVVRDRRTGKIRDLEEENRDKEEKEKRNSEQLKKYSEWGKGIEQTENKRAKLNEDLYEMAKPLARYCDDEDLEDRLKSIIYDDDPMSEYIKKKRRKDVISSMPEYNGPPPPPNRFGIKPGYRWDGVDRSNGFEKKYFEKHSSKKCIQEEAYLWSVQNM